MQVFKVQGMTRGHRVRAITHAVQAKDSAADVQVDLGAGEVRVASRLDSTQVLEAIREEGYGAELAWTPVAHQPRNIGSSRCSASVSGSNRRGSRNQSLNRPRISACKARGDPRGHARMQPHTAFVAGEQLLAEFDEHLHEGVVAFLRLAQFLGEFATLYQDGQDAALLLLRQQRCTASRQRS